MSLPNGLESMFKDVPLVVIQEIASKYLEGCSAASLSKQYPFSEHTIKSYLKKHGVPTRNLSQAQSLWQKGKPKSEIHRLKLSISKLGKPAPKPPDFGKYLSAKMRGKVGELHPGWKGGKQPLRNSIRRWIEYQEWRTSVFVRDSYTCQECFIKGGNLQAHHIVRVNEILKKYNLVTREEALLCSALWDIANGMTLCSKCHPKVEKRK